MFIYRLNVNIVLYGDDFRLELDKHFDYESAEEMSDVADRLFINGTRLGKRLMIHMDSQSIYIREKKK